MRDFSQPELVAAILMWLDEQGIKSASSRQVNAVIKAADDIIAALVTPDVMARPAMGLQAWLASDDTGMSSRYMAKVLAEKAGMGSVYVDVRYDGMEPADPSDFGRCVRLLEAVPELRPHLLSLTESTSPKVWQRIAGEWDSLEAMYREELPTGNCPKLYKRLTELRTAVD